MKVKLLFIFYFLLGVNLFAQQIATTKIIFNPVFNSVPIIIENKSYRLNQNDSIIFETLRFYVSDFQLLKNGTVVFTEPNSFHLIDSDDKNSLQFLLSKKMNIECDEVRFNLGIDSITNVSGAMGGDLDPTKGMYWTWQSGYINLMLEGRSKLCTSRNNEFQFHLGGYQFPYNAIQQIDLKLKTSETIEINFDLKKFFDSIKLAEQNHVMSPNEQAIIFSKSIAKCFYINQ